MVRAMIIHWIKQNQQHLTRGGVAQYAQHITVQPIKTGQLLNNFMLPSIDTQC